jgi:cytochrome c-type biogenesis protein CcmH
MRLRRAAVSLLAAWALLSTTAAAAVCPRTTEVALESRIMCQLCGVPLALANSLEADRERALITQLVDRCESASQIEAAMVAEYGPSILATPGTQGFDLTAWLVPAIGIAAAALAIAAVVASARRLRRVGPPAPPLTAAEDARLDAALAAYAWPRPPRPGRGDGTLGVRASPNVPAAPHPTDARPPGPTDAAAGGP